MEAHMPDRPIAARKLHTTIGQIISALDDRNVLRAMRLLEPVSESPEPSSDPDQPEGQRCVKCATRGE
jgi:hypothetical protein